MNLVTANIKWIMLVSGALTCTMVYAAIAPQAALHSMFGETLEGPVAEIVVRNWGALVTLVGAMLICGAFNPMVRAPVLIVAGASKLTFITLVLSRGWSFLGRQLGIAAAIDLLWVVLFAWFLLSPRREPASSN
jgi:ABC-type cobalamin transport system permease subunit